jgi:NAD/NADP transhydrogenase alpha subunit
MQGILDLVDPARCQMRLWWYVGGGDLHAVVLGMIFGVVATVFLARGIFGGFLVVFLLVVGVDFAGKAGVSTMKEKLQVELGRERTQRKC